MAFQSLNSPDALQTANTMSSRIFGTFPGRDCDILDFEQALLLDEDFVNRAQKPHKETLLHVVTQQYLVAEWNYARRKEDDFFIDSARQLLTAFNIPFRERGLFNGCQDQYNMYI